MDVKRMKNIVNETADFKDGNKRGSWKNIPVAVKKNQLW